MTGNIMDTLIDELQTENFSSYLRLISTGAYGKIYSCKIEGEECVLKIQNYKKQKDNDESTPNVYSQIGDRIRRWSGEIEKMLYLQDHNLSPYIYYYGFYYDKFEAKLYNVIVMEKLEVVDEMIVLENESGNIDVIIDITLKSLETINHLNNIGVSHRDYKWDNIGCRIKNGVLSVVPFDFGVSRFITQSQNKDMFSIDRIRLITTIMCLNIDDSTMEIMYNLIRTKDMPPSHMLTTHTRDMFKKFDMEYTKLYDDTFVEV
jgi:serine/threonine protein kinase